MYKSKVQNALRSETFECYIGAQNIQISEHFRLGALNLYKQLNKQVGRRGSYGHKGRSETSTSDQDREARTKLTSLPETIFLMGKI